MSYHKGQYVLLNNEDRAIIIHPYRAFTSNTQMYSIKIVGYPDLGYIDISVLAIVRALTSNEVESIRVLYGNVTN